MIAYGTCFLKINAQNDEELVKSQKIQLLFLLLHIISPAPSYLLTRNPPSRDHTPPPHSNSSPLLHSPHAR